MLICHLLKKTNLPCSGGNRRLVVLAHVLVYEIRHQLATTDKTLGVEMIVIYVEEDGPATIQRYNSIRRGTSGRS